MIPSGQQRILLDLGRSGWIGKKLCFSVAEGTSRVCIGVRIESRQMGQPWRERRGDEEVPQGKRKGIR